jgi:hypothetical protein
LDPIERSGEESMPVRGPKVRTAQNSRARPDGEFIRLDRAMEPTCELTAAARREFVRLVAVLRSKGSLELVDLAAIADLARMTDLLNRAVKDKNEKMIPQYQSQVRGLRRELGLTRQPSRVVTRVTPGGMDARVYWQDKLNGTET